MDLIIGLGTHCVWFWFGDSFKYYIKIRFDLLVDTSNFLVYKTDGFNLHKNLLHNLIIHGSELAMIPNDGEHEHAQVET